MSVPKKLKICIPQGKSITSVLPEKLFPTDSSEIKFECNEVKLLYKFHQNIYFNKTFGTLVQILTL